MAKCKEQESPRPRPDDNALLRKRTRIASFWPTVHTDPENALFWKRVSGWRNPKTQPSRFHVDGESAYFPKRWRHRPTSHNNNNNNNNGGLHACICATEDISPFLQLTLLVVEWELQQQFSLINGPHKRLWFPCTSHFHLLLLVSGFCVYCLVNVKRHLYIYFSGSVWMQIFLKRWRGTRRKTRSFSPVWTAPKLGGVCVWWTDQTNKCGSCSYPAWHQNSTLAWVLVPQIWPRSLLPSVQQRGVQSC